MVVNLCSLELSVLSAPGLLALKGLLGLNGLLGLINSSAAFTASMICKISFPYVSGLFSQNLKLLTSCAEFGLGGLGSWFSWFPLVTAGNSGLSV